MSLPIPPLPPPTGITTQTNALDTPAPASSRRLPVILCEAAVINWIDPTTVNIPLNPFKTPPNPAWRHRFTGPPHPPGRLRTAALHPWVEAITGLEISANSSPPATFAGVGPLLAWLAGKEHRGCLYFTLATVRRQPFLQDRPPQASRVRRTG